MEFIVNGPAAGVPALLVTRTVDTGQGGENDPNRALATHRRRRRATGAADAARRPAPLPAPTRPWLGDVQPVRVRKLYFSEKLENPNDPNSASEFYLTVDGQTPKPSIRPMALTSWCSRVRSRTGSSRTAPPNCTPSTSTSCTFMLLDWSGMPVNEPFLRDTVNVPYFSGRMLQYPSVRLRMDFRDPDSVGTFVYHCHLLEHEDGGMMGTIVSTRRAGMAARSAVIAIKCVAAGRQLQHHRAATRPA